MKKIFSFTIVFSLLIFQADAQGRSSPRLIYFYGPDSLVGVKTTSGRVIIPATFNMAFSESDTITEKIIGLVKTQRNYKLGYWTQLYYFDRSGKFLYQPYWFDNGPDYLKEGLSRFIENNKIGFVDRYGTRVMSANVDYAEPFSYGLSFFCNGCYFYKDSTQSEHNIHLTGGKWGIINKKGYVVVKEGGIDLPGVITDSLVKILAPFTYTTYEKTLIKKLEAVPNIKKYLVQNYYSDPGVVRFEIVERPSDDFPYFWFKPYAVSEGIIEEIDGDFVISKDGNKIFYMSFFGEYIPISEWIEEGKKWEASNKKK